MIPSLLEKLSKPFFDTHMQEIARGTSRSFVIHTSGTLLGFTVSVIIARLLGADGSGIYYLATAIIGIGAVISKLGFENTVVRFVATHHSAGEWSSVRFVYQQSILFISLCSILVALLLFFSSSWFANQLFNKPVMKEPLMLASLAVIPFSLAMIHSEALRGLKRITLSQLVKSVLMPMIILTLIFPFVIKWSTNGAIAAYLVAALITAVISIIFWSSTFKEFAWQEAGGGRKVTLRQLFSSSWPLFGVVLTGLVIQQGATFFLGIWSSTANVGIFNVANRVSSLMLFPLFAVISILAPKLAELHRQKAHIQLTILTKRSSLLVTTLTLPAVLVVFTFAEQILKLFGTEFIPGLWVLRILLLGVIVNAVTGPVGNVLMMSGHERTVRTVMVVSTIVMLGLCIILIPFYGIIGAATATCIGSMTQNIYMTIMVKQKLGFWIY